MANIKTIYGVLKESLVIEAGNEITVIPAGVTVGVETNDEYPDKTTNEDIENAVEILNNL